MKLILPENISLRWELWRGFGKPEMMRVLLLTLPVLIGCIFWISIDGGDKALIGTVLILGVTIAAGVGFFGRMDGGMSIYAYLRRGQKFHKEQQIFRYIEKKEVIYYAENNADGDSPFDSTSLC